MSIIPTSKKSKRRAAKTKERITTQLFGLICSLIKHTTSN
jgi:hypothetical protein